MVTLVAGFTPEIYHKISKGRKTSRLEIHLRKRTTFLRRQDMFLHTLNGISNIIHCTYFN